jgi:F-type H+-transporting ATPase subunit alpha
VLVVQSGLLDPLSQPAVIAFRQGLSDAIDRGAADAVRMIQNSGTLDEARKQRLLESLRQYAHNFVPPAPSKAVSQP